MSTPKERRELLLHVVEDSGFCTIGELAQQFQVSEMTIRRDVARLVDAGLLRSFHGGVSALQPQDVQGSDYGVRLDAQDAHKHAIARHALNEIAAGSIIGFDAGTTVAVIAAQIDGDAAFRAVTASMPVLSQLVSHPGVSTTALGGLYYRDSRSFAGPATVEAIENLSIDVLFLAASGLSAQGVYCANDYDALTKRSLINISQRVVLVSDSSKFRSRAMVKICGWDAIDTLIVDDQISAEDLHYLTQEGVSVQQASAASLSASNPGRTP